MKRTITFQRHDWSDWGRWEWINTDYTGRWKIKRFNDDYQLWIECFEIVEKKLPVETKILKRKNKFLWFEYETLEYVPYQGYTWRANATWVHEDSLNLEVIEEEEFINICTTCNEEEI